MSDRELLELAAKAANIPGKYIRIDDGHNPLQVGIGDLTEGWWWNPLEDDGDALRLAVAIGMNIYLCNPASMAVEIPPESEDDKLIEKAELNKNNPCEAIRRAIVRAAAEIGRGM